MKPEKPYFPIAIGEIPEEERPCEHMEKTGTTSLCDAELLSILFRTGTSTIGAVKLAETVLNHFGVLRQGVREVATGLILSHNHPSGESSPTPEYIEVTQHLQQAGGD